MTEFRFRAAAALELRRKQETEAGTALARAEAELRASEQQVADAEAARREAQEQLAAVGRQGSDAMTMLWHRNWIIRLTNGLSELRGQTKNLADAVRKAEQHWRQARQRRLALERMQERGLRRFKQQQLREELKLIDELARVRYVTADAWGDDS